MVSLSDEGISYDEGIKTWKAEMTSPKSHSY